MVRRIEKIHLILMVVVSLFSWLHASELELYLQAKKECQAHHFDQAIELFKSIPSKGDAVLYNVGVCYFEQGDRDKALAYWHLALSKASYSLFPMITKAIVDADLQHQGAVPSGIKWYCAHLSTLFSLGMWQILILLVCLLLAILFLFFGARWIVSFGLVLILLICICYLKNDLMNHPMMITDSIKTSLYVDKNEIIDPIDIFQKGTFVKLLQKAGQWYKIRHHDQIGWVKKDNVLTDDQ